MKASLRRRVEVLERRTGSRRCPHWSTGVKAFLHILEGFCPTCLGPCTDEGPNRCQDCGMLLRLTLTQTDWQATLAKLQEAGVFDEDDVTFEE